MKNALKNKFREFVKKNNLLEAGDKVLVAVSGGIDSIVLLHLLLAWRHGLKIEIGVVHLHHGLRGKNADDDLKFVSETTKFQDLPFYSKRISVSEYARESGLSLEHAGHQLRKNLFEEIAAQHGYHKIATAHHLNDQAETVLMRLISGSGLQGLTGIRLKKEKWIRPLLFARRSEIEKYAGRHNLRFRLDETNDDKKIVRNKIRLNLLPLLENEYDSRIVNHLGNLSNVLLEWDVYLENEFQKALKNDVLRIFKNKINLELSRFNLYFSWIKIRLLEYVLSELSGKSLKVGFSKFADFKNWSATGRFGSIFCWGNNIKCTKHDKWVTFFSTSILSDEISDLKIFPEKWYQIPGLGIKIKLTLTDKEAVQYQKNKDEEYIDGTLLIFPLLIRTWAPGDKFRPLGFSHDRLVSDYLTDCKIWQPERGQVKVLVNTNGIVALPGIQIGENYKIKCNSNIIYRINVAKINNG